jgi:DNA polymerase III sliding clamp (beta) subunit (PCNA family)
MRIKIKIVALLFICVITLNFCSQKKLFEKVQFTGRLIHYNNQHPAQFEIHLKADNVYISKSSADGSVELASTTSAADGTFTLKSKASKRNRYYLQIITPDKGTIFVLQNAKAVSNVVTNVGDIVVPY